LQSGLSRELFEMWCPNPRNGCVIAGYSVEGTLAKVRRPVACLLLLRHVPLPRDEHLTSCIHSATSKIPVCPRKGQALAQRR
jgi:Cft2 family RNA processing exonuclease